MKKQKFPVWGFGVKYDGIVRNAFQLGPKAEVGGVEGIKEAYRNMFRDGFMMSGPTVISEVIKLSAYYSRKKLQEARQHGRLSYGMQLSPR